MKKATFIFTVFLIVFSSKQLFSQNPTDLPVLIPPSPTAFQMTQYGDVAINESTGNINPSIPIYTYKAGRLAVPISLSFQGNGVKVDQAATWTGINWNLNAGGVITRSVKDGDDLSNQTRNSFTYEDLYDTTTPESVTELNNFITGGDNIDSEADIFSFVFPLYLVVTYLIVPNLAPAFGREKIKETEFVQAHSLFYKLANRNYVRPELNNALEKIATEFEKRNSGIKIVYLDANFPFIDKFPLLPHLSHNDGKKIDVSLIYENQNGKLTNKKPSVSGYGAYESPTEKEYDQISICKNKGNWQYDFPKYLTLGKINKEIKFSSKGTRELSNLIVKQNVVGKLFIEPHLKNRLNLTSRKVRFHGCQAVRHDDHIHFQLK